jgi:histidine ammonia-lyase
MSHLWDAFFRIVGDAPAPGPEGVVPELFGLSLRYPAAALFTELKQLAAPATLDCPPLDLETEDHATSAPLSVRKADSSLELLEDLLAVELLLARDVLHTMPRLPVLGAGTSSALRMVDEALAAVTDRSPEEVHRVVRTRLPRELRAPGRSAPRAA